jgi:murein DD-endopeptidase MepM/ murein hydrolase activator NlpD
MGSRRLVFLITDDLGGHRGRVTVLRSSLWMLGSLVTALMVLTVALACHGAQLTTQALTAPGLVAQKAVMDPLCTTLTARAQALQAMVDENERALVLLYRKNNVGAAALTAEGDGANGADEPSVHDASQITTDLGAWSDPAYGTALLARTDALLAQCHDIEGALADLMEYWRDAEQRLMATPSIRPARSPYATSSYGVRIDPVYHYWVMHKGLDLGGFTGMLVYAPADGIVIWTGTRGGYGQVVVLDHGMGLQTHYAHLSQYLVKRGDTVRRGDPIAQMGSTGKSTGPHLHYEVRQDGVPMDPRQFILD